MKNFTKMMLSLLLFDKTFLLVLRVERNVFTYKYGLDDEKCIVFD